MWYGNRIYYLSDQDANRRANIWVLDTGTRQTRQVTHFSDYDIDFPALGGDAIAFQQGGKLYRLDLPGEHLEEVPVLLPDDGLRTRARVADVKDETGGLRAGAKRQADVVLGARRHLQRTH
jgi:tricorn protease